MKIVLTLCLLTLHVFTGNNFDKTSVTINENSKTYEFIAIYPVNHYPEVLRYMDESLDVSTSFKNTEIDTEITLDNKCTFYMKSRQGELKLKFDRRMNTPEAYLKLKKMCEGLKDLVNSKS